MVYPSAAFEWFVHARVWPGLALPTVYTCRQEHRAHPAQVETCDREAPAEDITIPIDTNDHPHELS